MSKQRRTVSIDDEADEYLAQDGVNASELVNKLVKAHATAGGNEQAMLQLRKHQLQSEVAEMRSRTTEKEQQLEQVCERLSQYHADRDEVIAEAREALDGVPRETENLAMQNWAEEAEMPVDEFIEALDDPTT